MHKINVCYICDGKVFLIVDLCSGLDFTPFIQAQINQYTTTGCWCLALFTFCDYKALLLSFMSSNNTWQPAKPVKCSFQEVLCLHYACPDSIYVFPLLSFYVMLNTTRTHKAEQEDKLWCIYRAVLHSIPKETLAFIQQGSDLI